MTPEERQPGYISLKEASERFGYSQDYLGQLIRKGKLEGKLVYSHVAWVTTEDAVGEYIKNSKKRKNLERAEQNDKLVFGVATKPHLLEGHDGEAVSFATKWLIRIFRVLLILTIFATIFVFYLLTTAFGEELHSGTFIARASVSLDQLHENDHE